MEPSTPALRDPAHRVSTRAPLLWLLSAAIPLTVVAVAAVVATLLGWFDVPWWVWPAYAVLVVSYLLTMPRIRYRVHRWESTDTAVYTQTGWLGRERRLAPMSRVQTVDFEQSPLSRLLGLATVTVTTASAAGALRVEALDADVAQQLVDDLTRRAEDEQGDAT